VDRVGGRPGLVRIGLEGIRSDGIGSTTLLLDTTLASLCTLFTSQPDPRVVPTRQTSSSGRPKSPRIQVVLPEDLCQRLAVLAEDESRTVSNMAKVLIQLGVERLERERPAAAPPGPPRPSARPAPVSAEPPSRPTSGNPASANSASGNPASGTDRFRAELERRQSGQPSRLRGAPRRLRLRPPAA
jgi:hypothetical protein